MPEPSEHEPSEQASREEPREPRKKPPRRWFQFGLSTLLAVTALAAGGAMAWRVYVEPYRLQREAMAAVERLGGTYQTALDRVVEVDVSRCQSPPEYLHHLLALPALEKLAVGGPAFGDEQLLRLRSLTRLRRLTLDSTSVSNEGLIALHETLPLAQVTLSDRQAIAALRTKALPHPCSPWRNVEGLSFVQAEWYHYMFPRGLIDDDLAELLGKLPRIGRLDLRWQPITDAGLAHLARDASELEDLLLPSTRVTDAGLAHLASLSRLEVLDLGCTQVSDDGLAHLKPLRHLRALYLDRTHVTPAGLAEIRRALPDCTIYADE
jgi:hypothetical protein